MYFHHFILVLCLLFSYSTILCYKYFVIEVASVSSPIGFILYLCLRTIYLCVNNRIQENFALPIGLGLLGYFSSTDYLKICQLDMNKCGRLTHFMPLVSFYTPWKQKTCPVVSDFIDSHRAGSGDFKLGT